MNWRGSKFEALDSEKELILNLSELFQHASNLLPVLAGTPDGLYWLFRDYLKWRICRVWRVKAILGRHFCKPLGLPGLEADRDFQSIIR